MRARADCADQVHNKLSRVVPWGSPEGTDARRETSDRSKTDAAPKASRASGAVLVRFAGARRVPLKS